MVIYANDAPCAGIAARLTDLLIKEGAKLPGTAEYGHIYTQYGHIYTHDDHIYTHDGHIYTHYGIYMIYYGHMYTHDAPFAGIAARLTDLLIKEGA